jgi:hypothetical protein
MNSKQMKKINKYFKKIYFLLFAVHCGLFLSTNSFANDTEEFVNKDIAIVRVMNKAAGKAQAISLPVGKISQVEKLSVRVRACKQTAPYTAENFYMFVEIKKNGNRIFSGWMDRNEPGDNPLQDSDYDLWLLRCE